MAKCDMCGNNYDRTFEVIFEDKRYVFDSFECAIHLLAPICEHCGCKMIGHGVQAGSQLFCCANCAQSAGVEGIEDRVPAGTTGGAG